MRNVMVKNNNNNANVKEENSKYENLLQTDKQIDKPTDSANYRADIAAIT